MPQPLLDLRNISFVIQRIGGGRGPQGMCPETFDVAGADHAGIVSYDTVDAIGRDRPIEFPSTLFRTGRNSGEEGRAP